MASSYVEFSNNGFWANDALVSIIAGYLYVEITKIEKPPIWLHNYASELRTSSYGYFIGFTSLSLDDFIVSENRKRIILTILETIECALGNEAKMISLDYFNNYVDDNDKKLWSGRCISRDALIKAIDFIKRIINGQEVEQEPHWARLSG